jgi:hypothetical protein
MIEGLSELVAACGTHKMGSPAERIAEGVTNWFIGYPAAAPNGMVALAQNESLKLVFRQEDIRQVHRHKDHFLVRVSSEANVLVTFEQVVKASAGCVCSGGGAGADGRGETGQLARGPRPDVIIINQGSCAIKFECFDVNLPIIGTVRVCVPTDFWCAPAESMWG